MLRITDCIADRIRPIVPQTTEWQHIGNQIDTALIFARAHFVWFHEMRYARARGSVPYQRQRPAFTQLRIT